MKITRKSRIQQSGESAKISKDYRQPKHEDRRDYSTRTVSDQSNTLGNRDTNSENKQREYFKCRKVDHIAKNCPQKKELICFNCDGAGHISINCENLKSLS